MAYCELLSIASLCGFAAAPQERMAGWPWLELLRPQHAQIAAQRAAHAALGEDVVQASICSPVNVQSSRGRSAITRSLNV